MKVTNYLLTGIFRPDFFWGFPLAKSHLAEVLPLKTVCSMVVSTAERRLCRTHKAQHSRDHHMECLGKLAWGAGDSVSTRRS